MKLVYVCNPGEGPEIKQLGAPYGFRVTPGVPWECERDEAWVKELCERVPQVQIVQPEASIEEQEFNDGGEV